MRRALIPYSLLLAGLLLTVVAAEYAVETGAARDRLRFDIAAYRVKAAIENRMDAYIAMLQGGSGLFAASADVSLEEFRAYVERLELPRRYPGIQGIGFSRLVRPGERAEVEAAIRRQRPGFQLSFDSPDAPVHAIVYLEPQDGRNQAALGFDMYAEATRREAMDRACETAAPSATRRVRLVQEIDPAKHQAGFLIYVPVYRGGAIPGSVEGRRAALQGFVYSPFRAWDLLGGIESVSQASELVVEVFDGPPADNRPLHLPASGPAAARFETSLLSEVAGRTWTLVIRSGPQFTGASERALSGLIVAGGTVLSLLLFAVIMTQVRAREAAERTTDHLRRSEEALRAANQAKDEFLAIVSHELRTPLNAIVGWAAMLRRDDLPSVARTHAIDIIQRNAAAQTRLIEDLLDVSRAVSGGLRLEIGNVNLTQLLSAAVDAVKPAAGKAGVALDTTLESGLGMIRADQARLQQVVLNVLENGIKFTPAGGRVLLGASRAGSQVTIRVTDSGAGIPPEFLPHVFERFRQADTTTTRAHSGVGLGLAISRHIVELHGGTIHAASEGAGRGSTFTITLPAEPPPRAAA